MTTLKNSNPAHTARARTDKFLETKKALAELAANGDQRATRALAAMNGVALGQKPRKPAASRNATPAPTPTPRLSADELQRLDAAFGSPRAGDETGISGHSVTLSPLKNGR